MNMNLSKIFAIIFVIFPLISFAQDSDGSYKPAARFADVRSAISGKIPISFSYACRFGCDEKSTANVFFPVYKENKQIEENLRSIVRRRYELPEPEDRTVEREAAYQRMEIDVVYIGDWSGYVGILANNNGIEIAELNSPNIVQTVVGLILARKGIVNNQAKSSISYSQIDPDSLKLFPNNPRRVLVTRISHGVTFFKHKEYHRTSSHEAITLAYEDITDEELMKQNYENGILKMIEFK